MIETLIPMRTESEFDKKKSAAIFSRYLECLQMEVGLPFVPNVIESLQEILALAETFPWIDRQWRESRILEVKACAGVLSLQEEGATPIPLDSRTNNSVRDTDRYHRAAFFCQSAGELHLQAAALKLLIFSVLMDSRDGFQRVPKKLITELRTGFCLRRKLDTLLRDFPSPCTSKYLGKLIVSLSKDHSDEGVESFRRTLSSFMRKRQFSSIEISETESKRGETQPPRHSSPHAKSKDRTKRTRKPRGKPVYFKPPSKKPVSQYPEPGSLIEGVEIVDGGLPLYRLYFGEDDEGIDTSAEDIEIQSEASDLILLNQAIRSSHWMRHQRSISQASLRMLTKVERRRFLREHLENLSSNKASVRAWSIANLVAYQTPLGIQEFLFVESAFSELFDETGRYHLDIVRVDTGYKPKGSTEKKFRGYLAQTRLPLRGGVGQIIAELILKPGCKTFAESLGVGREEIRKTGKKMTLKLRDGNRYLITQSKVENALFNGLSDLKENSSLAFLLAGKSSQMYTTLLFYWGIPEKNLLDAYDSVVEDFLWV